MCVEVVGKKKECSWMCVTGSIWSTGSRIRQMTLATQFSCIAMYIHTSDSQLSPLRVTNAAVCMTLVNYSPSTTRLLNA